MIKKIVATNWFTRGQVDIDLNPTGINPIDGNTIPSMVAFALCGHVDRSFNILEAIPEGADFADVRLITGKGTLIGRTILKGETRLYIKKPTDAGEIEFQSEAEFQKALALPPRQITAAILLPNWATHESNQTLGHILADPLLLQYFLETDEEAEAFVKNRMEELGYKDDARFCSMKDARESLDSGHKKLEALNALIEYKKLEIAHLPPAPQDARKTPLTPESIDRAQMKMLELLTEIEKLHATHWADPMLEEDLRLVSEDHIITSAQMKSVQEKRRCCACNYIMSRGEDLERFREDHFKATKTYESVVETIKQARDSFRRDHELKVKAARAEFLRAVNALVDLKAEASFGPRTTNPRRDELFQEIASHTSVMAVHEATIKYYELLLDCYDDAAGIIVSKMLKELGSRVGVDLLALVDAGDLMMAETLGSFGVVSSQEFDLELRLAVRKLVNRSWLPMIVKPDQARMIQAKQLPGQYFMVPETQ